MAKAVILNDLLKLLDMRVSTFEKEIEVSNSTIAVAIKRNSNLSTKIIEKIVGKFPDVNKQWLMTGEGDILQKEIAGRKNKKHTDDEVKASTHKEVIPLGKHVHSKLSSQQYVEAFKDWPGLPMYNMPITASFIATYRDVDTFQPQYYLHDPRFRDCDFGAIITGDSMHSEIRHGDFIACKEITDTRFIVFGDIYYVVATNGLETCKYINADPHNPNNFLLVPRNENISPSPIPKDMILKMYKVRGIIRGY